MKLTVIVDIDMDAYRAKYGPDSEHWNKHRTQRVKDGGKNQFGPTYHDIPLPAEAYEFNEGSDMLQRMVVDMCKEGFYDWDKEGWLRVEVEQG